MENILFTPINLGTHEVKNRLVMASTTSGLGDNSGAASERNVAYLRRRAEGGVGMIVTEGLQVHSTSNFGYSMLRIDDDRYIKPLAKVARAVQQHEVKIIAQIIHIGRQWHSGYSRLAQWGPSPSNSFPVWMEQAHEMEIEEIQEIIQAFGDSARRVIEAGFDGVEIHGAHGFLVQQFVSPLVNKRTDEYGGTLEKRLRFLIEIIDTIRKEIGQNPVLGLKFSAEEIVPGGLTLEDTLQIISLLESQNRLDYYLVSAGGFDSIETIHPTSSSQVTPFIRNAAAVKKVSRLPVIAVGKIKQEAGAVIAEGMADMVAFARPLICDPDVPRKMQLGRHEEIRSCLSCNECHHRIWHDRTIGCAYNAETGHESEPRVAPTKSKKQVAIVGGGPAGCEAARVAALRGHQVTLFERSDSLGGRVNLAAMLVGREDMAAVSIFFSTELDKLGVEVRLETEATPENLAEMEPDVVVFATGVHPSRPKIPGIDLPHVYDMDFVIAEMQVQGEHIVVYDQEYHVAGSGTAELLTTWGKQVTLITDYYIPGPEIEINTQHLLHRSFVVNKVSIHTDTRICEIQPRRVIAQNRYGGEHIEITEVDAVILCNAGLPENALYRQLKERFREVHLIGDAFSPRRIISAVRDAYVTMREI